MFVEENQPFLGRFRNLTKGSRKTLGRVGGSLSPPWKKKWSMLEGTLNRAFDPEIDEGHRRSSKTRTDALVPRWGKRIEVTEVGQTRGHSSRKPQKETRSKVESF